MALLLRSPWFWIGLVTVLAVAGLIFLKRRGGSDFGFKDFVKNPALWGDVTAARAHADDVAKEAWGWDDDKVASLTKWFVLEAETGRDAWQEGRILRELGSRTHPTVMALLADRSLYGKLVTPTGKDIFPEAPVNRACKLLDILEEPPPEGTTQLLAPFMDDPSKEIRKDAVLLIGSTGLAEAVPLLRKALADEDEYLRSFALMGLARAVNRGALEQELKSGLFPDVMRLLEQGKNADKAANILFQFDAERAKAFFLSDKVLVAGSRVAPQALLVLANERVDVSGRLLLDFIGSFPEGELKYPDTYALGAALRLLGQQGNEEDRKILESFANHGEEKVEEGAVAGLVYLHGLEDFEKKIEEAAMKDGYEAFPDHHRYYLAVNACDGEVNNGGLSQYFVNSSGNDWKDALAGFEAMEFRERLAIFREALAFFGPDGPSTDRDKRQDQLSKLYRKNDEIFSELEKRYYDSKEFVQVFATRFVLAHPESFR